MLFLLLSLSLLSNVYRCFVSNTSKLKSPAEKAGLIYFNPVSLKKPLIYFLSPRSLETVSLWRPFFLRLAKTLRPLALSIRLRKPCTDFLRRLWG